MGIFSVEISLGGPQRDRWITVSALVDTGSTFTAAPASAFRALGIEPQLDGDFEFGHGETRQMDIGLAWVRLNGLETMTQVMFNEEGTEPILGAVTLEQFLLAVDPVEQRLIRIHGRG